MESMLNEKNSLPLDVSIIHEGKGFDETHLTYTRSDIDMHKFFLAGGHGIIIDLMLDQDLFLCQHEET